MGTVELEIGGHIHKFGTFTSLETNTTLPALQQAWIDGKIGAAIYTKAVSEQAWTEAHAEVSHSASMKLVELAAALEASAERFGS